ncbi:MAG: PKD domain-containing protein, partial [Crocinitomicaceae bacterium]|nr:PKD domain-containing protein [Crocinitomicaceae bacterium]
SFYPPVTTFEPQIGLNSDSSYWLMPAPHVTNLSADGNTVDILPTAPGTFNYEYYVIDNFGCSNDSSVNLTVNENPIVDAGNDTIICLGNNLQLLGELSGPGAATFCDYTLVLEDIFFDGWNGATITVTIGGVATDYTLNNGGLENIPLSILSGSNVTVTFNANGFFPGECFYSVLDPNGVAIIDYPAGQNAVITDNFVADCVPDFTYDWSPAGSLNDPTIIDPFMTVAGNETLTLTVFPTGHPLCAVSDDINVSIVPVPDAGVDSTASFCDTGAPSDLFPLLGPTAEPLGVWTDPNGNVITMPYDPTTMPPGLYSYTLGVNGCLDVATVDVTHLVTSITSMTAVDVSCNGLTDGSITFDGVNADGYTINGGMPVVSSMPVTIDGLAPGNYDIIIASADGCFDNGVIEVLEPELLTVAVTPVAASCFGICDGEASSIVNGGTGTMTYTWLQDVNGDQNGNATGICSGNYQLEVTDANGCQADAIYFIDQPENVFPGLTIDTAAGCYPHQVDFVNTTGSPDVANTYIDFGDGSTITVNGLDDFEHTYESEGVYTVTMTVTTVSGCVYTETYDDLVEAYAIPNANFYVNPDFVSMLEPTVSLYNSSSSDVVQYDWTIYDGTPVTSNSEDVLNVDFPLDAPGLYPVKLEVESNNGCIDSITKFITIINDVILYAPNTFTPDDDEHNQAWEFHISGIDVYDFNLKMFNRWGQIVWESNDPSVSWDGTYNGRIVQNGLYTWTMECGDGINDKRYNFNGHVNVIR